MSKDNLSVAVIGLGAFGQLTLDALVETEGIRIVGIGEQDPQRLERVTRQHDLPGFTDNRQLLLTAKPDVVFLATPPMIAGELLEACARRGIHVWKEAPLARNLTEAAAMVRRFDDEGLKLAVGTQRRFAETYRLAAESRPQIGRVFLARAHYLFNGGPELRWRGDLQSAGGGAMLELGFHPIDLLTWMLGVPEEAYALAVCEEPDPTSTDPQPQHDTDDSAAAILRYTDDSMASIVTSRISGPVSEEIALHGEEGSIVANADRCLLRTPNGDVLHHLTDDAGPLELYTRQVQAFLHAVRTDATTWECSAAESLATHAIIDAIYLSTRTGQPESPLRQLQMHSLTPDACRRHRPTAETPTEEEPTEEPA